MMVPAPDEESQGPFVTGSHAYGTPTEKSDVDLVVLVAPELRDCLKGLSDIPDSPGQYAMRFGKLNLICCTAAHQYECWAEATNALRQEAPVSRDRAINVMREFRKKYEMSEPVL